MQKINFQNLPSTLTPINATNLNAMQTNVENVFNGIETMGNIVVDSIKTKNLFDINGNVNVQGNSGNIVELNSVSNNILTCNVNGDQLNAVGQKFTNLNGKTITFSAKIVSFGTGNRAGIFVYDNGILTNARIDGSVVNDYIYVTYTATSNNIVVAFATGGGTGAQYTDIQVEIGSVRTDYTPYQDLNYQEIYSTGETIIGTWVDGKTLYRKVVLGTLVDGDLAVDLRGLNIYEVIKVDGFCGNQRPLNFYYSGLSVSTRFSGGYMYIFASSSYANDNFKMIIEYTKNS